MTTERHHILEMLAEKKINPEEAEQLLGAIRPARSRVGDWLFRPLERLQTRTAVAIAISTGLLQLLVSRLQIRFDGALDVHLSTAVVPLPTALLDLVLAWLLVAAIFWGAARLVAKQGRLVDFVAAVGVARIPLIVAGAITGVARPGIEGALAGEPSAGLIVFSLVSLLFVAWFVALLVTGLRTASGLRGMKLGLTAAISIVVAELGTMLLLRFL